MGDLYAAGVAQQQTTQRRRDFFDKVRARAADEAERRGATKQKIVESKRTDRGSDEVVTVVRVYAWERGD